MNKKTKRSEYSLVWIDADYINYEDGRATEESLDCLIEAAKEMYPNASIQVLHEHEVASTHAGGMGCWPGGRYREVPHRMYEEYLEWEDQDEDEDQENDEEEANG